MRRRHLSRGRPRKYEPQNSSNGNEHNETDTDLEMKNNYSQNSDQVTIIDTLQIALFGLCSTILFIILLILTFQILYRKEQSENLMKKLMLKLTI